MPKLGCGLESGHELGQCPVGDKTRTGEFTFKVIKVMVGNVATTGSHVPSAINEVVHLCRVGIAYECKLDKQET